MDYKYSPSTGKYYAIDGQDVREVPAHVAETGKFQTAMVGAADTIFTGARNVGNFLWPGRPFDGDQNREALNELQSENPITYGAGKMLPALATIPLGIGTQGLYAQTVEQGLIGAGIGALGSEPGQWEQETVLGGAAGAAGGLAGRILGNAFAAAGQAVNRGSGFNIGGAPTPSGRMAQQFEQTGGQLTPASSMNLGRRGRNREANIESSQWGADLMEEIGQANQANLQQLTNQALGIPGVNVLDGAGFTTARESLENSYRQVAKEVQSVSLSPFQLDLINDVTPNARMIANPQIRTALAAQRQGEDVGSLAIPSNDLLRIRSEANARLASDSPIEVERAGQLIDSIDEAIEARAGAGTRELFRQTRAKDRLLRNIEQGRNASSDGVLSPRGLAATLERNYGKDYVRVIQEELGEEAAPFAKNIQALVSDEMKVPFGSSGTAERSGETGGLLRFVRDPANREAAESYMQGGWNAGWIEGLENRGLLFDIVRQATSRASAEEPTIPLAIGSSLVR